MTGAAEDEVVELASQLIAIDTTNTGEPEGTVGEREATEYVAGKLTEVGYEVEVLDSGAPGRSNVFCRLPGADRERGALLVHGHLDVVPAEPAEWSVHPFSGAVQDGYVWGRGAVDMKDMDAMMIAVARRFKRDGVVPPRDLVFGFIADEEAGGALGAQWLVENRPDLFEGCTEAVGEVGGFSLTVNEQRMYLIEAAEKGLGWMRLRARGVPGHGSVPNDENAIVRLAEAISRIAAHKWPREFIPAVRTLLDGLSEITGTSWSDEDLDELLEHLGGAQGFVRGTLQDTSNVTMLDAGYKHNVIPQHASANVDCRFLPGHEDELLATVRDLAGEHVDVEVLHRDIALDAPFEGDLVEAMVAALRTEDPDADVLPYCLSGGTDNKALSLLGVTGYGFAPLRLPADLDFAPMFHGIDERVPVESLHFGTRVLLRLLETC